MDNYFGFLDYISVAGTLLLSLLIGIYFARKNNTNEDLLVGGRKISSWPVAASIMASYVSAVTVLGFPAEVFGYGVEIFNMGLVALIMFPISVKLFVPVLYPMKLTSIFEYVEHRFKCSTLRKMVCGVYLFEQTVLAGVVLYGPSLVLVTFLGIPNWLSIFGIGLISTLYTSVGGIRAVVWTDAFQAVMMLLGMVAILVKGIVDAGGFSNTFAIAQDNGRLNLFKFNFDIFQRHNFFNFFIGFGFMTLFRSTLHQPQVQRFSSQPTLKEAMNVMYKSIPITFSVKIVGVLTGIALFAVYHSCDPVKFKKIETIDHLVPYFVVNQMTSIPGMLGLFTACIFSGVLSSISSIINSLTAVTWTDILSNIPKFAKMDDRGQANVSRVTGLFYGLLSILLAFSAQYMGSVYTASFQAVGATNGVVNGIFMAGMFMPFINKTGAKVGIIVSLTSMLTIGSRNIFSTVLKEAPLPTTIDNCPVEYSSSLLNSTLDLSSKSYEIEWPEKIFALSYLMYPIVGATIFIIVATLVSYCSGGFREDQRKCVDDFYLHPFLRSNEIKKSRSEITQCTSPMLSDSQL